MSYLREAFVILYFGTVARENVLGLQKPGFNFDFLVDLGGGTAVEPSLY